MKQCPMSRANPDLVQDYEKTMDAQSNAVICTESDCAWWDEDNLQCSMCTIAWALRCILMDGLDIRGE